MSKSKLIFRIFTSILILCILGLRVYAIIPSGDPPQKAKYVFLFIGDGMGLAQVNLTEAYLASLENKIGLEHLNFTKFPQVGLVSTYANNDLITCSAAAGTALATGHKTNIGRISMDTSGTVRYESIASKAKRYGYKVGIVTNTSIDNATPAVFYSHMPDRDMYFEIGIELTLSNFDYYAGGNFTIPDGFWSGSEVNLIQNAWELGFKVIDTREGFDNLASAGRRTIVLSPRLGSNASLPYSIDMNPEDITLSEYTSKGIGILDNDKGFFMMVEGGKIDWACHENDAATVIQEIIAFDKSIGNAVDFYQQHPDETLIIVTADHETGGLALGNSTTDYNSYPGLLRYQKSSESELNNITSLFRANKTGDSEADFTKMLKVLESEIGLNSQKNNTLLSENEISALKMAFMENVYGIETERKDHTETLMSTAIRILAENAGIGWSSSAHTFVNVPIYTIGTGAEKFSGYIDNTDVPKIIEELMGIKE